MSAREQLTLDLGHAPGFLREEFVVCPSNRDAVAWIDRWPDWPEQITGLNIVGPAGCGKTHLGIAWRRQAGAAYVDRTELVRLPPPELLDGARHLLVDGVDADWPGLPLLQLYNIVMQQGGTVLVLSRVPCGGIGILPADLASRLASLAVVAIGPPEDRLLHEVMAKMFRDRQLRVEDGALAYITSRMDRTFEAAGQLVEELDRASLTEHRSVTLPLARLVLGRMTKGTEGH